MIDETTHGPEHKTDLYYFSLFSSRILLKNFGTKRIFLVFGREVEVGESEMRRKVNLIVRRHSK